MADSALQDLLVVQDLDTSTDQLRHRRSHLAERSELAAVEAEEVRVGSEAAALEADLQALGERQQAAEAELSVTEQRAAAITQRLFGGQVSASRDLQAMSAELEQLKTRASALEDAVLEVMEEREPLEIRAGELQLRSAELAKSRAEIVGRIVAAEGELDGQLADVAGRRTDAAAAVPAPLLATYEKLRARLGGVGVARLVGNHCDGCHLTLPAAELDRVRHLPEGQVYQCEQCSRILVP